MARLSPITPGAHTDKRMWPVGTPCTFTRASGIVLHTTTIRVPRKYGAKTWGVWLVGVPEVVNLDCCVFRERRVGPSGEAAKVARSEQDATAGDGGHRAG